MSNDNYYNLDDQLYDDEVDENEDSDTTEEIYIGEY